MKKCNRLSNGFIPDVFYAKATGRLPIMEQELFTLSETLEFTPFYYGVCVAESLNFLGSFPSRLVAKFEQKIQILRSVNNLFKKFFLFVK